MPWSGVLGDTEASSGWSMPPGGAAAFGGGAEQWGLCEPLPARPVPFADSVRSLSLPPLAQRALSGAEGAGYTDWAAGQLRR